MSDAPGALLCFDLSFGASMDPPPITPCKALLLAALCLGACAPAAAVSLQDLLNGDSLVVNDSRWSDWELALMDATAGVLPDLALVTVTPQAAELANPGVQFDAVNQFAVNGLDALDLVVRFQVTPLPGGRSFTGHSLTLVSLAFGGEEGTALVSQEAIDHTAADLGPALVMADNQSDIVVLNDDVAFSPRSSLSITLNLFEQGLSGLDSISIAAFKTHVVQDGPVVLAGDYNSDDLVDAADYTAWRDHLGDPAGALPNNVDGGPINVNHYLRWRSNYGASLPPSPSLQGAAVPEPSTVGLGLLWAVLAGRQRRLRQTR